MAIPGDIVKEYWDGCSLEPILQQPNRLLRHNIKNRDREMGHQINFKDRLNRTQQLVNTGQC